MADNTTINPGSGGDTIATDDIAGVKYPRSKITLGNDGVNDGDVSKTNPIPSYTPASTPTNISGTITLGGTAQQLAAANANRRGFWVQNLSTGDLWVNDLATAVQGQPSIRIPPNGSMYETPPGCCGVGAISIIGATTSQAFSAREW